MAILFLLGLRPLLVYTNCFLDLLDLDGAPNNGTHGSLFNVMSDPLLLPPIPLRQIDQCFVKPTPSVDETCSSCGVNRL